MRNRQADEHVQAVLAGIANRARVSKRHRFGGVYTLLNEELLRRSFYNLNRKAAPGVDEVTWAEYESNLDVNLQALVERLKRKAYRARLVRRHYIPKGNGKRRPLGIPVLEDKLVQHAAKTILEAIYEADFVEYSFAYRPGRSAKDAARELCFRLQFAPLSWLVEADIRVRHEVHKRERFEFLGFEFRWGQNRHKRPQVKRRTVRRKLRAACSEMQAWIKKNRHVGIRPLMATLGRKLRGHWNYFGVPHNSKSLWEFYRHVCTLVYKWLNRRSQRRSFTWARLLAMLERYQIPKPSITEKSPKRRYSYV